MTICNLHLRSPKHNLNRRNHTVLVYKVPLRDVGLLQQDAKSFCFHGATRRPVPSHRLSVDAGQVPTEIGSPDPSKSRRGCGRRASDSAIGGMGGGWICESVVVCHSQACSGPTSCKRRVVSRSPRLSTTAPSTVSGHPGDIIDFHLVPLEARPGPLKTPRYLDAEISVCPDSPAQVHKLDRLFVYLAGCIDGERHLPPTFSLQAHFRFGLGDRKPKRRARSTIIETRPPSHINQAHTAPGSYHGARGSQRNIAYLFSVSFWVKM